MTLLQEDKDKEVYKSKITWLGKEVKDADEEDIEEDTRAQFALPGAFRSAGSNQDVSHLIWKTFHSSIMGNSVDLVLL